MSARRDDQTDKTNNPRLGEMGRARYMAGVAFKASLPLGVDNSVVSGQKGSAAFGSAPASSRNAASA